MPHTRLAVTLVAAVTAVAPTRGDGPASVEQQIFETMLSKHENLTGDALIAGLEERSYLGQLSFDPGMARHFARVRDGLALTPEELAIFGRNGFVSIDLRQRLGYASAYYAIYARDLPVLITTDSILNALHKSYDDILIELETVLFMRTIDEVLTRVHSEIAVLAGRNTDPMLDRSYADLDLYVCVARNLLAGAGTEVLEEDPFNLRRKVTWDGRLIVASRRGQDESALDVLNLVKALEMQVPDRTPPTSIYGGRRFVDFSQFRPRGHYTKSAQLQRYFRTMMWLGRADCGFNVLPPDLRSGLDVDDVREARDAALLCRLLSETGGLDRLRAMSRMIDFLVGDSDDLTLFSLVDLLETQRLGNAEDLADDARIRELQRAVASSELAVQRIRSQVIVSNPLDPSKVPPPAICQVFGQRFLLDSFVLSQVVYDSIIFEEKVRRMMPRGLDVVAALGNDEAVRLLADDLRRAPYAGNLKAAMDFVEARTEHAWHANLYMIWLDCLRTLDDEPGGHGFRPQAMRTRAWQMKQLQTQLGSWAQLRHDTILYGKQSYSAYPACEYPDGYVEPYPAFFAKLRRFAARAAELFGAADYTGVDPAYQHKHVEFMERLAGHLGTLEILARKELAGEAFSEAEVDFLKKTIDARGLGSGPPRYDGWYTELYYGGGHAAEKWDPTIADVHTDPESSNVLEVGVGDVNFLAVAVDCGDERTVYVGPVFSYYEFEHPAGDRLTDERWWQMIREGNLPARPAWTDVFQGPAAERRLDARPRRSQRGR